LKRYSENAHKQNPFNTKNFQKKSTKNSRTDFPKKPFFELFSAVPKKIPNLLFQPLEVQRPSLVPMNGLMID